MNTAFEWIFAIITLAAMLAILLALSAWDCHARWADSGFQSRFQVPGGCQIKMKDGRWIPAERYRELDK